MTELKEICKVQCGFAFDSKKFTEDDSFSPLIRIRDVKRGFTQTYYTGEFSSEYIVHKGDLLVGMDGEFNIARWNSEDALLNQRVCRIVANSKVNEEYLRFYLKRTLKLIESKTSFVTVKHLSAKELNVLKLNLPCMEDQQRISKRLSILELVIRKNKKVLELFDELVKARFVEMFGDPVIGTEKWPIHTVDNVAEAVDPQPSHRTPPIDPDGIPYVSIKDCDLESGNIDFKGARRVSKNVLEEHLKRYELHDGDFIIGKIGTVGNPIFVPQRRDYALSANVVLVQPNKSVVRPYFLKYSFESEFVERQFNEAKNSTSQAAFGIQKVRLIRVMNPSLNVQDEFEKFAIEIDKSRSRIQKSLEALQELFDSLMQEYFG